MLKDFYLLNTEPNRYTKDSLKNLSSFVKSDNIECDRNFIIQNVHKYEALLIGLKHNINHEILNNASKLKCIITPTTGLNHVDLEKAKEKNIEVISLFGETEFLETVTATAELTWGILLSLLRKIPYANQSVINNNWDRDDFYGIELKDKTLGVIGYGRLGKMVANYGKAFKMHVIAYDINPKKSKDIIFLSLNKLLSMSDIVSIHLPLNKNTTKFADKKFFKNLKKGSILINTSRGEIINENELLLALKNKNILGAAVDVLGEEYSEDENWLKNNILRKYAESNENLIITPHIGGVTHDSVNKANNFIIKKFYNFLKSNYSELTNL